MKPLPRFLLCNDRAQSAPWPGRNPRSPPPGWGGTDHRPAAERGPAPPARSPPHPQEAAPDEPLSVSLRLAPHAWKDRPRPAGPRAAPARAHLAAALRRRRGEAGGRAAEPAERRQPGRAARDAAPEESAERRQRPPHPGRGVCGTVAAAPSGRPCPPRPGLEPRSHPRS